MSAYIVFIRDKMKDRAAYDQYIREAAPTLEKYDGEIIVFNGANEALEGPATDGGVVLRFPDMAFARAWYGSAEYCQSKPLRLAATEGRAVLFEGVGA